MDLITNSEKINVGELHEKWQFPSDHLPIGVRVDDLNIISWNVLNNTYIDWVIDKDSQGLKGSMISDLNVAVQSNGLTKRDQLVVEMINAMSNSSDVIALQECGIAFLAELQDKLPPGWQIIKMTNAPVKDQDVILYNASALSFRPDLSNFSYNSYPSTPGRGLMDAVFEKTHTDHQIVRILNGHIPGDPNLPGKEEFTRYVYEHSSPEEITIALGDHNFERDEMLEAYKKVGFTPADFEFYSPWCTNIDPYTKESKAIDHVFVKGATSHVLKPKEILDGYNLQETIELLNPSADINTINYANPLNNAVLIATPLLSNEFNFLE